MFYILNLDYLIFQRKSTVNWSVQCTVYTQVYFMYVPGKNLTCHCKPCTHSTNTDNIRQIEIVRQMNFVSEGLENPQRLSFFKIIYFSESRTPWWHSRLYPDSGVGKNFRVV